MSAGCASVEMQLYSSLAAVLDAPAVLIFLPPLILQWTRKTAFPLPCTCWNGFATRPKGRIVEDIGSRGPASATIFYPLSLAMGIPAKRNTREAKGKADERSSLVADDKALCKLLSANLERPGYREGGTAFSAPIGVWYARESCGKRISGKGEGASNGELAGRPGAALTMPFGSQDRWGCFMGWLGCQNGTRSFQIPSRWIERLRVWVGSPFRPGSVVRRSVTSWGVAGVL